MRYRLILLFALFGVLIALQYVNSRRNEPRLILEPQAVVRIGSDLKKVRTKLLLQKHDKAADLTIYPGYKRYLQTVDKDLKDSFYYEVDTGNKVVVLSFDDGPLAYTRAVMTVLENKAAPATFFLLCSRINERNSNWYHNPLFGVGIHSYQHQDYRDLTQVETDTDFNSCLEVFETYGLKKEYFRPPYGVISKAMVDNLKRHNLTGILWSLDSGDWDGNSGNTLIAKVIDNLRPGSIILFHDGVDPADLSAIIDAIYDLGYQIISLADLLKYPKIILDY